MQAKVYSLIKKQKTNRTFLMYIEKYVYTFLKKSYVPR